MAASDAAMTVANNVVCFLNEIVADSFVEKGALEKAYDCDIVLASLCWGSIL